MCNLKTIYAHSRHSKLFFASKNITQPSDKAKVTFPLRKYMGVIAGLCADRYSFIRTKAGSDHRSYSLSFTAGPVKCNLEHALLAAVL